MAGANTVNPDQGPGIEYETVTRPPLAGPYAFSKLPKPVDDLPMVSCERKKLKTKIEREKKE